MKPAEPSSGPSRKVKQTAILIITALMSTLLAPGQTNGATAASANSHVRSAYQSSPDWIVPAALFAAILGFAILVALFKLRQSRMMHETLRLTIEKGQPIPPDLLRFGAPQPSHIKDLRYGLVCIALGLGLAGYGWESGETHWTVGLIPFLIGLAFLVTWKFESRGKSSP